MASVNGPRSRLEGGGNRRPTNGRSRRPRSTGRVCPWGTHPGAGADLGVDSGAGPSRRQRRSAGARPRRTDSRDSGTSLAPRRFPASGVVKSAMKRSPTSVQCHARAAPAASAVLPLSKWSSRASRTRRRPKASIADLTRSPMKVRSGSYTAARINGVDHGCGTGSAAARLATAAPTARRARWRPVAAVSRPQFVDHHRLDADQVQQVMQERLVRGSPVDCTTGQRLKHRRPIHRNHRGTVTGCSREWHSLPTDPIADLGTVPAASHGPPPWTKTINALAAARQNVRGTLCVRLASLQSYRHQHYGHRGLRSGSATGCSYLSSGRRT